jgi:hypothetical protein
MRGDWNQEGYSLVYHKPDVQTFRGKHDITHHKVTAHDHQGNLVGSYYFSEWPEESEHKGLLHVTFAKTHPLHQRKGLASAAYKEIEKQTGKKLHSDVGNRSEEAKALWSQPNRAFGKSIEKNMKGVRAGILSTMLAASPATTEAAFTNPEPKIEHVQRAPKTFDPVKRKQNILRAIAQVESSGGKNTAHKLVTRGVNAGTRSSSVYGLMPITIKETIKKHPDLSQKYGHLTKLSGDEFHEQFHAHPELDKEIAKRHYDRLSTHFGHDPVKIGMAWLQGVVGAKRMLKRGVNFENHWHVKKIMKELENIRNEKSANPTLRPL